MIRETQIRKLWVLVFCLMSSLFAFAQSTPAGTLIPNQAQVVFTENTGVTSLASSNKVLVTQALVESLTLVPDQSVIQKPGSHVVFTHKLTNTGNGDSQYSLTLVDSAANNGAGSAQSASFSFANLKLYFDSNGNGQFDSTDAEITTPISVSMASSVTLFVVADVPSTATAGSKDSLVLTATSGTQHTASSNTDTVSIAGAKVQLQKSADVSTAKPGSTVTYTLQLANNGATSADAISVTVDGVQRALVLASDVIPANATLAKIVDAANSTVLYHLAGDSNPTNFVTAAPSDLTKVDEIAFGFAPLAAASTNAVKFAVTVNANASGTLSNFFSLQYTDVAAQSITSNTVNVTLPAVAPTLAYYTKDFSRQVNVSSIGSALYVQANASACNLDPRTIETQKIRILSLLSGDDETFVGTEISANSGTFRVDPPIPTLDARTSFVQKGDGKLEVLPQDKLTASIECGGQSVTALLLLDPAGVVFDSSTNAPIAGAVVSLIDVTGQGNGGKAGQTATVFAADGITAAPSTVTTSADGRFQFPNVLPSSYRLEVKSPNGYKAPSTVAPQALPAGRNIDASGSYLNAFNVDASTGTVMIDVPVDPTAMSGLFVQKQASKTVAELGDFVDYTVQVRNSTGQKLAPITITDQLPVGVTYIKGTARLDKANLADPISTGRTLQFNIAQLADKQTVSITYRVLLGAGTNQGKVTNIAQATSGRAVSNQARAVVEVQGGVLDSRGFIVGEVHTTCQDDSGAKTFAVPGVRIMVEDGTFAITDARGRYSIYGLRPQTHVVKVDGYTLPKGSQLLSTNSRNARDGDSMFVDMKFGELRRADFDIACTPQVRQQVADRIEAYKKQESAVSGLVGDAFNADVRLMSQDSQTQARGNASGIVGRGSVPDLTNSKKSASDVKPLGSDDAATTATPLGSNLTAAKNVLTPALDPKTAPVAEASTVKTDKPAAETTEAKSGEYEASSKSDKSGVADLASVAATLDDTIGFANLKNGEVVQVPQVNVWVKGPKGSEFKLKVNGADIDKGRIGSRATLPEKPIEAWEFIGVTLKTGKNTLTVSANDPFGNERSSSIEVIVPDEIAKIVITVPQKPVQADGYSLAHIKVAVFDRQNLQVKLNTQVTLETSAGQWLAKDYDPIKPGVQTFIQDGIAEIPLIAPTEPGDVKVRISTQQLSSEATVSFIPEMRPVTAAGIAEYQLNFRSSSNSMQAVTGMEGFEESLRLFSSDDGASVQGGSRTAFFLKGKVLGSNLLTMAYDSNRTTGERLFRDIQPDQYYPVYGDASVKGFDAQSTSKLYLRVDNGKSYLLYGDFQTSDNSTSRVLTNYSRSMTGMKQHYEGDSLKVSTFASYDTYRQVVEEFAANGTSGPYTFQYINGVENSEKVEILTRDRNQLALIIDQKVQSRFSDYEFEPFTGRLIFKSPVSTLDEKGNPQFIRVTYEVDQGGPRFWTGGIDSSYAVTKRLKVGTMAVADSNPEDANQLYGFTTSFMLPNNALLSGEVAASHRQTLGSGVGYRFEYKQQSKKVDASAYFGRTDESFKNESSMLNEGRGEAGGTLRYHVTNKTQITGEFLRSEDVTTGGTQVGGTAAIEHQFAHRFSLKFDVRHAEQSAAQSQLNSLSSLTTTSLTNSQIGSSAATATSDLTQQVAPNSMTAVGMTASVEVPQLRNTKLSADVQQDVTKSDKQSFALAATMPLGSRGKLYARHEFLSSLGSQYNLNGLQQTQSTVVGFDFDYYKNAHAFTEYREGDELENRQTEAAMGLRNLFQVTKHLGITTGFESIRSFSGQDRNSFAMTTGFEYKPAPDVRASGKFEFRNSTTSNSYLTSFALGREVNEHLTLLSRNVFLRDTTKAVDSTSSNVISSTTGDSSALANTATGASRNQARFQIGAAYRGSETSRWDILSLAELRVQDQNSTIPNSASRMAVFSTNVSYQPLSGFAISSRYSTKWLFDKSNYLETDAHNQLLSAHMTQDLGKKMDMGFNLNLLGDGAFTDTKLGLGAELGYQLKQNLWLSSGYNLLGFTERDLPGGMDARQGAFVRLRFKFDEKIFKPSPKEQLKKQDSTQK